MKVVIIGCTHAGTAAAVNTIQQFPNADITIYERNDNVSFLSCGIALYVEGIIKDPEGLFYSSPDKLKKLGIKANMKHDVISINMKNKTMLVKDLITEEEFSDTYDKLIIATGSWPILPPFPGHNLSNILLCKNYDHAKEIIAKTPDATNVAVVGAGYIGVELVEAFIENGKNVTLIDVEARILSKYMDEEFTSIAEEEFKKKGATLALGEKVIRFAGDGKVSKLVTDKKEYDVDLVILCIGFLPNTRLFKGQIDMLDNGAIIVDDYMQTSITDVFAAGDCCAVHYIPLKENKYIPLATNAIRMGTIAAENLVKPVVRHVGTQGSSGIKIYDLYMAATGLTELEAKKHFRNVKSVLVKENYRPEFMPAYTEVTLKLTYDDDTGNILGAQLVGTEDYTQTINTLSVCIFSRMTIAELAFVDQFFQPHFNKPWNLINTAGLAALK